MPDDKQILQEMGLEADELRQLHDNLHDFVNSLKPNQKAAFLHSMKPLQQGAEEINVKPEELAAFLTKHSKPGQTICIICAVHRKGR
jgi:hypothetical protein